jgi:hypothetical protein
MVHTTQKNAGLGGPASEIYWSGRQDSNLRPLDPQSSALPGCATPRQFGWFNVSLWSSQPSDQARSSLESSSLNNTSSS